MEVVLLLVAITGIALIVVPRMQARRAGAGSRRRVAARPRPQVARAAAVAPVATTWSPPAGEDEWEDDLGWEGADPPAREEWNRWRSARAGAAEPRPVRDELPSVQRWRERATSGDDWLEDDDGLGWEGEAPSAGDIAAARNGNPGEVASRAYAAPSPGAAAPHGLASPGNGAAPHGVASPGTAAPHGLASPGNGAAPHGPASPGTAAAPHGLAAPGNGLTEPDALASRAYAVPASGAAASRGLASPATADRAAPSGGGSRGFDWLRPGSRDAAPAAPRGRRRAIHPVVLVALYAAAGIGAVVLASTVLLGGGSTPSKPAAQPTATPAAATPAPQPTVDASAQQAEQAAAAKAAERREIAAFRKQRAAARRAEAAAIAKARAKARADARKRADARNASAVGASSGGNVSSPPPPAPTSGRSAGGDGGGGSTCEFCIG